MIKMTVAMTGPQQLMDNICRDMTEGYMSPGSYEMSIRFPAPTFPLRQ